MAVALGAIDIPIQWHFQGGMAPPAIPWRKTAMRGRHLRSFADPGARRAHQVGEIRILRSGDVKIVYEQGLFKRS